jgi:mannan endo-1,4-beta-mannosidase
MKQPSSLILLACAALALLAPQESRAVPTANANASATAKKVLNYLSDLPSRNFNRLLIGQNTGHGDNVNTTNDSRPLFQNTGVSMLDSLSAQGYPAMIGADYEYQYFTSDRLLKLNEALKAYWNNGGLVTINWTPVNPWEPQTEWWNYPGLLTNQGKLEDLINSNTAVYTTFRNSMDRIAVGLTDLKNAGVVVLFRPLQEMDGTHFWYGVDYADYINLYRYIYNYFTTTKGLNNLLWVYSPQWYNGVTSTGGLVAYPGAAYVDIVAPTSYSDNWSGLLSANYNAYKSTGKVLGLGEAGPRVDSGGGRGNFDNRQYLTEIKTNAPAVSFLTAWSDWYEGNGQVNDANGNPNPIHYSSIRNNWYYQDLLGDWLSLTRNEVGLSSFNDYNKALNYGFQEDLKATSTPSRWSTWSPNGTHADADYVNWSDTADGGWQGNHWKASAYEVYTHQTASNLVNGNYTFSAYIKCSGGQTNAQLQAKKYNTANNVRSSANFGVRNDWTKISITGIPVANNKCEIAVYSKAGANQWVNFDRVEFYKE